MKIIITKLMKNVREKVIFLKQWCANPRQLGSLIPSSRFLGRAMAEETVKHLKSDEYVVEIGSGTGSLTRALLEAGISPDRLLCVEIDPYLVAYLKKIQKGDPDGRRQD